MNSPNIIINSRVYEQRLQAVEWCRSHISEDKWQLVGTHGIILVLTDLEDEFKFKLANGDLSFIKVYTKEIN